MKNIIAVTGVEGLNKEDIITFIQEDFKEANITKIEYFDDRYFENQIWSSAVREKEDRAPARAMSNTDFPMHEVEDLRNQETVIIEIVDIRTKERLASTYKDQFIHLIVKPKSYEEFNEWINKKLDVMRDQFGKGVLSECYPDYDQKLHESNDKGRTIIFERQHAQPLSDNEKKEIHELISPYLF